MKGNTMTKRKIKKVSVKEIIQKAQKSDQFKQINKLKHQIAKQITQTREDKQQLMALLYCHIGELFKNEDFLSGTEEYMRALFSDKDKTLQSFRRKYCRAMKLLHENKVPCRTKKALAQIQSIGMQNLFNGKIKDKKPSSSKKSKKDNLQELIKKSSPDKVATLLMQSINKGKATKEDFMICCINGKLFSSFLQKLTANMQKNFKN